MIMNQSGWLLFSSCLIIGLSASFYNSLPEQCERSPDTPSRSTKMFSPCPNDSSQSFRPLIFEFPWPWLPVHLFVLSHKVLFLDNTLKRNKVPIWAHLFASTPDLSATQNSILCRSSPSCSNLLSLTVHLEDKGTHVIVEMQQTGSINIKDGVEGVPAPAIYG